jgi:hypothetical protein
MSWKLFGQIAALIVIFALVMCLVKCLRASYCPMVKSKCGTCAVKGSSR